MRELPAARGCLCQIWNEDRDMKEIFFSVGSLWGNDRGGEVANIGCMKIRENEGKGGEMRRNGEKPEENGKETRRNEGK